MRCCAHVLNLIVCEGLKDVDPSIQVIRNVVRYVRSSPSRLDKFNEYVKIEKLDVSGTVCLDVSTRWNSTYLMLESALKYRKAFNRLEEDGQYARYFSVGPSSLFDEEDAKKKYDVVKIGPPSDNDWDIANSFMTFLKVFYEVTNRFSGSLYVTSSAYFHDMYFMHTHIDECIGNDDETLSHMAINMRLKYNKYWGDVEKMNPLLYIVVALDPRYKLSYVNWSLDDMYPTGNLATNLKKKVEETLTKLYDFYCSKDPKHGRSCTSKKSHNNLGGISESLSIQERHMLKYKSHLEAGTTSELSELDRYLKDNKEPMYESFDLLHWWKINGEKYKILEKVARDVLAVPVSTVASESVFSTGGRILDPFRSSLSPKIVQALVCTQNWIRADFKKQASVEYKDMLKEIEEIEEIEKSFASKLNICTNHID
ncbi:putative HAT dimerization domain, ribonuclease H-like superfamily, hAT-like transposase, RNase-H [Helianthus annuus]|nr:putative HAT dimerization domain, ribonuclease H-like superfamily, hAT-like transposase, RNase-H [Helianthus annuus]